MNLERAKWVLKNANQSPILLALIGSGAFMILLGTILNVYVARPPEEQVKLWFLDLAGRGLPMMLAGALSWVTTIGAYFAWNQRYLLLALCIAVQAHLLQEHARLWALAVIIGIMGASLDYRESD